MELLVPYPACFEFNVFLHIDWLPTKAEDSSLHYVLTPSWVVEEIHSFSKSIYTKVNATSSTGIWTLITNFLFQATNQCTSCTALVNMYMVFFLVIKGNHCCNRIGRGLFPTRTKWHIPVWSLCENTPESITKFQQFRSNICPVQFRQPSFTEQN